MSWGQYGSKAVRASLDVLYEITLYSEAHFYSQWHVSCHPHANTLDSTEVLTAGSLCLLPSICFNTLDFTGFDHCFTLSPAIFLLTLKCSVHSDDIPLNFSMSKTDRKILPIPCKIPARPLTTHHWSLQKQFFVLTTLSQTTFMRHVYEPRLCL